MTSPFSFFRRLLGVSLALALAASGAEALSGELRDGDVHHEDLAKAAAHHDVHGLGLIMPDGVAFATATAEWGFVEPLFHTAFVTGTLKHPPKV